MPASLSVYSDRAQLMCYEEARAHFESFAGNAYDPATGTGTATGTIFWMLNNAWPSIHWNLYDYYLKPAGSYFGAKKANEPRACLVGLLLPEDQGLQLDARRLYRACSFPPPCTTSRT